LDGNDFAADPACEDSASNIAGVFYGEDALETSGLVGFDATFETEEAHNTAA